MSARIMNLPGSVKATEHAFGLLVSWLISPRGSEDQYLMERSDLAGADGWVMNAQIYRWLTAITQFISPAASTQASRQILDS